MTSVPAPLSERHGARAHVSVNALALIGLIVVGLGPILLLAKVAITPAQDTLRSPMAFWPHGTAWSNLSTAWTMMDLGRSLVNTVLIAGGAWLVQLAVATTGGYRLSVLRPLLCQVCDGHVLSTLLVPSVVLLVKRFFNGPRNDFEFCSPTSTETHPLVFQGFSRSRCTRGTHMYDPE